MTTKYFDFSTSLSHILQRDPQKRSIDGKMHFASHTSGETAYQTFKTIMQSNDDLILTTGCGLPRSIKDVPLRLPATIVPGLELLRRYREYFQNNRSVTYKIYMAAAFIRNVNGIPDTKTHLFMQDYFSSVVEKRYSDLKNFVTFDFQKDVAHKELQPICDFFGRDHGKEAAQSLNIIENYKRKEHRRGDSLLYTAANIHFNTYRDTAFEKPTSILLIGGLKEEPFFHLSSLYHEAEGQKNVTVLPLCYKAQENPACYALGPQDVTMGTLFAEGRDALKRIPQGHDETATHHPAYKDFNTLLSPLKITPDVLYDIVEPLLSKRAVGSATGKTAEGVHPI